MGLTPKDRKLLEEYRANTRDKKLFVRCSILIMLDSGYSHEMISVALGISNKTVAISEIIVPPISDYVVPPVSGVIVPV